MESAFRSHGKVDRELFASIISYLLHASVADHDVTVAYITDCHPGFDDGFVNSRCFRTDEWTSLPTQKPFVASLECPMNQIRFFSHIL